MKGTKSPSQRWLICDDSRSVSPSRCYILASPRGHAHNDHNKAPFGRKPVTTDITGELSDCSPQSIVPVSLQAQTPGQPRAPGIGTHVRDPNPNADPAPAPGPSAPRVLGAPNGGGGPPLNDEAETSARREILLGLAGSLLGLVIFAVGKRRFLR